MINKQTIGLAGLGLAFVGSVCWIGAVITGKFPPTTQKDKADDHQR